MQVAILAAEVSWLTGVDTRIKSRLVWQAFNLLLSYSNNDDARFAKLSSSPDAVLSALRLVYEVYSLDNNVEPDADRRA